MQSAEELARQAASNYRVLKCTLAVNETWEDNCVPILEIHRGANVAYRVVHDRALLPAAIVEQAELPGPMIDACVFNVEVYTSHDSDKQKQPNQLDYMDDPDVHEALMTVAVTREGDYAIKVFKYYHLDDGGIQFEEGTIAPEKLGTLVYELKGCFAATERTR